MASDQDFLQVLSAAHLLTCFHFESLVLLKVAQVLKESRLWALEPPSGSFQTIVWLQGFSCYGFPVAFSALIGVNQRLLGILLYLGPAWHYLTQNSHRKSPTEGAKWMVLPFGSGGK